MTANPSGKWSLCLQHQVEEAATSFINSCTFLKEIGSCQTCAIHLFISVGEGVGVRVWGEDVRVWAEMRTQDWTEHGRLGVLEYVLEHSLYNPLVNALNYRKLTTVFICSH